MKSTLFLLLCVLPLSVIAQVAPKVVIGDTVLIRSIGVPASPPGADDGYFVDSIIITHKNDNFFVTTHDGMIDMYAVPIATGFQFDTIRAAVIYLNYQLQTVTSWNRTYTVIFEAVDSLPSSVNQSREKISLIKIARELISYVGDAEGFRSMELVSVLGVPITMTHDQTLSVGHISNGVYFVLVRLKDQVLIQKFQHR
jgi:hypothetical protein